MKVPAGNLASLGAGPVLAAMVTQAIYTCAGGLAVDQGKVLTSAPWTTWMTGWLKPLVFFLGDTWGLGDPPNLSKAPKICGRWVRRMSYLVSFCSLKPCFSFGEY